MRRTKIVPVPIRPTPGGAPEWLADLFEHTVTTYCPMDRQPIERCRWVLARLLAASTLPDDRQTEIRRTITDTPRATKGPAR